MDFKRTHCPGADERGYRISQGHDSAAALVIGGSLVAAAAEERFNLEKHSGALPVGATRYCLAEAGISLDEIDEIVHAFDYSPYEQIYSLDPRSQELYRKVLSREALLESIQSNFPEFPPERVCHIPHHLAHAASAYFTSGWLRALVVVIDGMGETQSATVYRAKDSLNDHEILPATRWDLLFPRNSIRLFNADEYKIMGLAPFGDPKRFRPFFEQAVELQADGTVRIPALRLNRKREERENYLATRQYLSEKLVKQRGPDEEITDIHRDVAAALQDCLNRVILHICSHFGSETGLRKLALAGGVALNCTANGKLMRSGLFEDIYVQPAAGDDGSALGAALYRSWEAGEVINSRMPVPFYGPAHDEDEVECALAEFKGRIDFVCFAELKEACSKAALLIADGRVLAWCRGRMEFGPRALGNRSISSPIPEIRKCVIASMRW
jgi:carbamoyltransferase